ncbi:hypothetical protein ACFW4O_05635 [Streptomyces mutabilis]|uniref:hypothetical protein n=1 Tax=Streptomyces TaxID=1883 RepID=UPI000BD0E04F|nr:MULTISPECIES: hypothetical protein [unclassified Streptomyces]MDN3249475.1 hypothetical protein [Streptomyces sp. ZSW22]MDN3252347.1 hypothetical protein [Streptomyces sp. MA25(2023)]MDQ0385873.1 hypothetical protein [Streptomyces sp. DSM 42143]PAK22086.1 hypothetical protein CJD44_37755 [Streptomyces sp. alain-838]
MDRILYHETRATGAALAATAVCAVAGGAVHGFDPLPAGDAGRFPLWLLGLVVLSVLVELVVEVRRFRKAVPLADGVEPPPDEPLRERLFLPGLFAFMAVPTLVAALVWGTWPALFPLASAAHWGTQALLVTVWERRNGRLLWRKPTMGDVGLATSPLSPRPPTRTATGAPPG